MLTAIFVIGILFITVLAINFCYPRAFKKVKDYWRYRPKKIKVVVKASLIALAFFGGNIYNFSTSDSIHLDHWINEFSFHAGIGLLIAIGVYMFIDGGLEKILKFTKVDVRKTEELIEVLKFNKEIRKKTEEVAIFDTFITNLICYAGKGEVEKNYDSYIKEIREPNANFGRFLESVRNELKELKVTILLLHPDSSAAKQRAEDLKIHAEDLKVEKKVRNSDIIEEMKLGIMALHNFYLTLTPKQQENLIIKLYNSTPPFSLFTYDKMCYLAYYGMKRSQDSVNFKLPLDLEYGETIANEYENIRDKSSIDLDKYTSIYLDPSVKLEDNERITPIYFAGKNKFDNDIKFICFSSKELQFHFNSNLNKWVKVVFENKIRQIRILKEYEYKGPLHQETFDSKIKEKYAWSEERTKNIFSEPPFIFEVISDTYKHQFSRSSDNISSGLKENNYYFLNPGINNYSAWQNLCTQWENLVEDTDFTRVATKVKGEGNFGLRKRRIVHFKYDYDNDIITFHPDNNEFKQHRDYKVEDLNVRKFELIEASYLDNVLLNDIIKFDLDNILGLENIKDNYVQYGTIHFFRIECSEGKPGIPSLEGWHQDEHKYLAFHLIKRHNVKEDDAITSIRSVETKQRINREPIIMLRSLDTVYVIDENVQHFTTDFEFQASDDESGSGYRDMMIIDFDEENRYSDYPYPDEC